MHVSMTGTLLVAIVSGLLLQILLLPRSASALTTYRVGAAADGACTHSNLALAILAAVTNGDNDDEILIADNQTYSGFWAVSYPMSATAANLLLGGGFDDCADTTPSGRTLLDGSGTGETTLSYSVPVVGLFSLVLRDLELLGGAGGTGGEGGGLEIDAVDTATGVYLENVSVHHNQADFGGGIHVQGALLDLDADSAVHNNEAVQDGGGVACNFDGQVENDAQIHSNKAARGGGIYLNTCFVVTFSGGFLDGVLLNEATVDGGGIFATDGAGAAASTLIVVGDVSSNTAGDDGGGILAIGVDTIVDIGGNVVGNDADDNGGGVMVIGATLTAQYGRFEGNTAAGFGGSVAVSGGGQASLVGMTLRGNEAAGGSAGWVTGLLSELDIESSTITDGVGATAVQSADGGTLELGMVSSYGNNPTFFASAQGTAATLHLKSSIIWEQGGDVLFAAPDATVVADCLIAHETASLPAGRELSVVDPKYVDGPGGDLHLEVGSPAVDYCDDSQFTPAWPDIDMDPRPVDEPVADLLGPYDLGADEVSASSVQLFTDGFESGNTSAWSSSTG